MKDQSFIDIGPANDVITEENMKQTYGIDVKIEFIEQANRKICIPLKNVSGILLLASPSLIVVDTLNLKADNFEIDSRHFFQNYF